MKTNGRNSCTDNSRHIAVRYFFTKDRIEKMRNGGRILSNPANGSWFFFKYMQGIAFIFFIDLIMGYTNISEIIQTLNDNNISFPIKERVEN